MCGLKNEPNKRKGGFLVGADNTSAPNDFDRMFEDEIAEMFYDEDIETLNKIWAELAKNQSSS
ncbi:hypothetical protein [Moraxella bovis]|uniref:Uncharacterized protein n=1 Tax=Moraxella bovis TaxID=476 RepID=A0AAQ2Q6H7_MORBO|nr:hypothetical protein [Moraxella bovis]AWY20132.1 hypothetical protein DQF64_06220 [Moraxella bovis]OOR91436.1 hypothetical protein B0182_03050 [Moraxella bovis]UYZ67594.1 hypothetical protein LP122_07280 [Moraxella bovis]UYZ69954.1 hypothetical protein LP089_07315 [Moraxella bovis]UYZ74127.1 hypothetical protein LP105_05365 [Moraxella bovis]